MCVGLASALAMKAERNATALKMVNSVTETMPIEGFYIPDAELERWGRPAACAYAAHSQKKWPALCGKGAQTEIHLEVMEEGEGGTAGVQRHVQTAEKKAVDATGSTRQRAARLNAPEFETAMPGMSQGIYVPENEMSQWDRSIAEWFAPQLPTGNDVLPLKADGPKTLLADKTVNGFSRISSPAAVNRPPLTGTLELEKPSFEAADERRDESGLVEGVRVV
ncbi:hypothetical protein QFC22_002128 [Naganishia vaughanmartiniae]|uniref:Uncharacterized protein n=1 Tax=Naganishia vaughanmartiniae TaxID=1424756 RepID=A0ACC2XBU0_9TREE|nr:hypothetical protein QFC22_002128 [Naganishia vaughanmartiniae]